MLTTHAAGSATVLPIASCSFVFRVVGFIIDDLKKKKEILDSVMVSLVYK